MLVSIISSTMALAPGTRLGPYEILSAIGAGGMGEVYRARDTKLGRDVALKVLPEAFAADAERMARFEREAKVLASLNHPNIATIHGLEESNGLRALVMELVEGPTLADRIAQGPIPLDEALPNAKQITEGLEYAHERGIVHRDLKPANIKITPEGLVKLLDFGLAKALEGDTMTSDPSTSPTLSRLATQAGIILGTAAYMSPEQAKGKTVDRRTDIWAFGCVLYEILTGKPAFEGETVSDVLAAVIRAEPEWSLLPTATPPHVRTLLHRCLQKDSRQRLQAIGDARIVIEETLSGAAQGSSSVVVPAARARIRERIAWAAAGLLMMVAIALGYGFVARTPKPAEAVIAQIPPPMNARFALWGIAPGMPALSPDGTQLAFVAQGADGRQLLWVKQLNSSAARFFEGTDNATYPFWSPDGRSIGYIAPPGKLSRIEVSGGPPITVAPEDGLGAGASWNSEGTILFGGSLVSSGGRVITAITASGGRSEVMAKAGTPEEQLGWPQFLPDGKHFLFGAQGRVTENSGMYVGSLDGGEPKLILRTDSDAIYAPPGYLLFVRDGTLMAQPFDASKLRLSGEAVPVAEHVEVNFVDKKPIVTVSENGTLVYETARSGGGEILWYDRSGKELSQTGATGEWGTPSISPDGTRLAVSYTDRSAGSKPDIWVYDLARGVKTRITSAAGINAGAFWSPDNKHVCFVSGRGGRFRLYEKAADGTGTASPLVPNDNDAAEFFGSWSADGRYLAFQHSTGGARVATNNGPASGEIWAVPFFGARKPFPVVRNGQFVAIQPALSPDGKWLAYVSNESGRREVYVVPFPHGSGKWQISSGGGIWPRWNHDGKELLYRDGGKILSVEIAVHKGSLDIGKSQELFQTSPAPGGLGAMYDISANGKKFVVVSESGQRTSKPLTVIVNWPALLKKQ